MDSEHKTAERQMQGVGQWANVKIGKRPQPVLPRYKARPFNDRRCPVCGRLGCGGC